MRAVGPNRKCEPIIDASVADLDESSACGLRFKLPLRLAHVANITHFRTLSEFACPF